MTSLPRAWLRRGMHRKRVSDVGRQHTSTLTAEMSILPDPAPGGRFHSGIRRKRSTLPMTDTELKQVLDLILDELSAHH
jgi:hypothetical protein